MTKIHTQPEGGSTEFGPQERRLNRPAQSPADVVDNLMGGTGERIRDVAPEDISNRVSTVELLRDVLEKLNMTQRIALAKVASQITGHEFDEKHLPGALRELSERGFSVVHLEKAVYYPGKQFDIDPLAFGSHADKDGYDVREKFLVVETGRPMDTIFVPAGRELNGVASIRRNDPFDTEIRAVHNAGKRYERLGTSVIPAGSRSFTIAEVRNLVDRVSKRQGLPKNVRTRLMTPMEWEILRLGGVIELNENATGEIFDNDAGFGYPDIVEAHADKPMELVDRKNQSGSTFRVVFELPN